MPKSEQLEFEFGRQPHLELKKDRFNLGDKVNTSNSVLKFAHSFEVRISEPLATLSNSFE